MIITVLCDFKFSTTSSLMENCEANNHELNITIVSGSVSATLLNLLQLEALFNAMPLVEEGKRYFTGSGMPLYVERLGDKDLKYMAMGGLHRGVINSIPYPKSPVVDDLNFVRYAHRIFPSKNPDELIARAVDGFTLSLSPSPMSFLSMIGSWLGLAKNIKQEPVTYNCNLRNMSLCEGRLVVKMPFYFEAYLFSKLFDEPVVDSGNSRGSVQEDYTSFLMSHFIRPIGMAIAPPVAKNDLAMKIHGYNYTDKVHLGVLCRAVDGGNALIEGWSWLDCSLLDRFNYDDNGRLIGMTVEPDECTRALLPE